jgi:hypothetical protein
MDWLRAFCCIISAALVMLKALLMDHFCSKAGLESPASDIEFHSKTDPKRSDL